MTYTKKEAIAAFKNTITHTEKRSSSVKLRNAIVAKYERLFPEIDFKTVWAEMPTK